MHHMSSINSAAPVNTQIQRSAGNHAIILFIRDQFTDQVITDFPLQATYAGYFASSNHDGQIIFPRKTSNTEFYLIITPPVDLVSPLLNNISHLQIPAQNEARCYKLVLHEDLKAKKWEWIVTEEDLPLNRHIPLHSIIIFADPNNVSMPLGTTATAFHNHLILPSIYLTGFFDNSHPVVSLPNNRPFLAKLTTAYSLTPYGYATMQIY